MENIPLVKLTRSGITECVHRGSIAVAKHGKLIYFEGNPYLEFPIRSTAKPFIAMPLMNNNGVTKYALSKKEVAVIVSSHNGEDLHRCTVENILQKIGLSEKDLKCGTHAPYFDWILPNYKNEISAIYHNCSGKHAGLLLLCDMLKTTKENYWDLNHPIQQVILAELSDYLELKQRAIKIGVDGCGVPTYSITLSKLAEGYAKLLRDDRLTYIKNSILEESFMLAGTDRVDSEIISLCGYIAKSGSEGIFCLSIPGDEVGIAIKIESGSDEAAESVAISILNKLGYLNEEQFLSLSKYQTIDIRTSTDVIVGKLGPI